MDKLVLTATVYKRFKDASVIDFFVFCVIVPQHIWEKVTLVAMLKQKRSQLPLILLVRIVFDMVLYGHYLALRTKQSLS